MTRLAMFISSEQLSPDDVLAEFRDESPSEVTAAVEKGASGPTAGAGPELIMADLEAEGDVSQAEIGTEPHNGTCPYTQQCEPRRRRLSTYRQYQPCHWRAWGDWRRCPIYRNDGSAEGL